MRKTLEKLWNGDITPAENCGENETEIQELTELITGNREDLDRLLDDRQKEILKNYIACMEEYTCLITAQAFCDGFSLAGKLLTEALAE